LQDQRTEHTVKGKILLVVGLGVGYLLGTRAGRERYEQIKDAAAKLWNDPRVKQRVDQAEDFVKDKAPEVAEFLADGAKNVVSKVSGSTPAKTPARKPSSSGTSSSSGGSTSKPSTSK
jgi:hypothetical protein